VSTKGDEDGAFAQRALIDYEKQSKLILAKVNDLIRFLHKHQSTMFIESYRKQNEAEQREEQKWIRYVERKRKRALQEVADANADASNDSEAAGDEECQSQSPPVKKTLIAPVEAEA
jgi:hypothetical protein